LTYLPQYDRFMEIEDEKEELLKTLQVANLEKN
jgi:hypothetical protein